MDPFCAVAMMSVNGFLMFQTNSMNWFTVFLGQELVQETSSSPTALSSVALTSDGNSEDEDSADFMEIIH